MAFRPGPAPKGDEYAAREFEKVAGELALFTHLPLKVLAVEPAKPRDGWIVCANGSDWNPGSGAGFYGRSAGAWVFLG
jgi:hypothetical protein